MFITTILQFSQLAILARFLTPEQFGLMALVTIVIGFSQAFVDMGMSNAIIHKQTSSTLLLSSLFWVTVSVGALITALVYLLAPSIASFYSQPELAELIQLVSIAFVISSLGSQHKVLLQKELHFKYIALVELLSALGSFSVAITLAWYGFGVYSLVYANIAMTTISSFLFFVIGIRNVYTPLCHLRWSEVSEYFSFGVYQMGERTVNYFSANIDKILIGKFLGPHAVGLYNVAWQLIIFPLSKLNPIVNKVALPVYGKVQNDPQAIDEYYSLAMKAIGMIVIPFSVYLLFFSQVLVEVVFGNLWVSSAPLVAILGLVGLLKAMGNPGGALILARGHAKVGFWWNVVWATTVLASLYLSLIIRPAVDTTPYVLMVLSLVFGGAWHYLVYRLTGVNYGPVVKNTSLLFVASVFSCFLASRIVSFTCFTHPMLILVLSMFLCVLTYSPFVYLLGLKSVYSTPKNEV